nr:MAG TPA: hypothetical protein [Caudoviricetes sp.]
MYIYIYQGASALTILHTTLTIYPIKHTPLYRVPLIFKYLDLEVVIHKFILHCKKLQCFFIALKALCRQG